MATTDSTDSGESMTWDGYTDYKQVAGRVASEIHDATAAAAMLQRTHVEGGQYDAREIAEATSRIMSAALLIEEQLAKWQDNNPEYQDILESWRGSEGEPGRIEQFQQTDFYAESPDWLFDFVRELNRAGLLLGYLKAGREEEIGDDGDAGDSEVMDVIESMTI